jgi:hypothetical protein
MDQLPMRCTPMSTNNNQLSRNRLSPSRVSPIPPTTNCVTAAVFPTVLEEEPETFSQTSSSNDDEHEDTVDTFIGDVGMWSPTDNDVPPLQEQCFNHISHRNIRPRRRLPVITSAFNTTSSTSQSRVGNAEVITGSRLLGLMLR